MKSKLSASVVAVSQLTESQKQAMFAIFESYYSNVNWPSFNQDLKEKNDVILLMDNLTIRGFSTLLKKIVTVKGKKVLGIYSGDTILEKKYWGSSELGKKFLAYLWMQQIKNPLRPVYWFLISKGYKTYLLMANNFAESFPRIEQKTPAFEKELMNQFYSSRFGNQYSAESGVISFSGTSCQLKVGVAAVTSELRSQVPAIDFFAASNPNWDRGDELACIARMTILMPLRYVLKKALQAQMKKSHTIKKVVVREIS